MIETNPPIVVYHVAAMGDWQDAVVEQFRTLSRAGLFEVRLTHVGHHADWLLAEAERWGISATLVRSDPNTLHYETFGIFEVERIARENDFPGRAILYMHTKGVSRPDSQAKRYWRRMIDHHVVSRWRENIETLGEHDAVGVNWYDCDHPHFAGNYWIARPDWIRRLPRYADFHNRYDRIRFTCEWWVGSALGCRAKSLVTSQEYWAEDKEEFFRDRIPAEANPPSITWVSACTRGYEHDLARLQSSCALLGPGHKFEFSRIDASIPWKHTLKFHLLRRAIRMIETSHVFWIDGDCEFAESVRPWDLVDPTKPLAAVRHFGADHAKWFLPADLAERVTWPLPPVSWQACLFGGTAEAVSDLLRRLDWFEREGRTYDEHGLVLEWSRREAEVFTLPCRFAAPTNFAPFPEYEHKYQERAGGSPVILHHNRSLNR